MLGGMDNLYGGANLIVSNALFTDFYELTMAQGYFLKKMNKSVVFDVFFRRNPFGGGYSVFAGLGTFLQSLLHFRFEESDIDFLRAQGIFCEEFLSYLKDFHFTGSLWAMEEGQVVFPQEPLVRLHAPLIEAQILEGLILNILNFQSLIASKTARVALATGGKPIMEFGLRRAQGPNGALMATRASFIGGATGTSNTLAGKLFDIPVMGTMAHSWVMSFDDELSAFRAYADLYPNNSIFLIDTYDTLKSGIKNAITAGAELVAKGHNFGVRLDSGDISYLTRKVRKALDDAGFPQATISVSNELTEEIVSTLVANNSPINSFGIGTHMVTGGSESSFPGVYKLAAVKNEAGEYIAKMKFSDNPSKTTNPGVKNVFRIYDEGGLAAADIIALEGEAVTEGVEATFFHPMVDYRQFTTTPAKVVSLLHKVIENGKVITSLLSEKDTLKAARDLLQKQLATLDPSYKRILNPHIYKVSLTANLKDLKVDFIKRNLGEGE